MHTYIHMYIYVHIHTHTYLRSHIHTCTHAPTCTNTNIQSNDFASYSVALCCVMRVVFYRVLCARWPALAATSPPRSTKEKIIVSSSVDPKVMEIVGESVMPVAYGGKSTMKLPGGDAKESPEGKYEEDAKGDDLAVDQSVAASSTYTFVKTCTDPSGGKFLWAMRLRALDVTLRIEWTPGGAEGARAQARPVCVVNAQRVNHHEGEFEVKSSGSLKFTFDNSYSFFRSKEVQCAIDFFPADSKEAAA